MDSSLGSLVAERVTFAGNIVQGGNGGTGGSGLIGGNAGSGGLGIGGALRDWGSKGTLTAASFSDNIVQGGNGGTGGSGTTSGGNGGQGGGSQGGGVYVGGDWYPGSSGTLLLEKSVVARNRSLRGFGGAGGDGDTLGSRGADGLAQGGGVFTVGDAMLVTKRTRFIDNTPAG
jgi:hypothetical protein